MHSLWGFLVVATAAIVLAEGRAVNQKPVAVTVDSYGNPIVYLRDKRASAGYPQRTMMFTGYYRPVRRSNDGQATGVFAQGNAVSGGSYVADKPDYLERGPEPIDESGVSSSEAEAAPNPVEHDAQDEQQVKYTPGQGQHEEDAPNQEQDQHSADAPAEAPVAEDAAPEPTRAPKRPTKTARPQKTKKRPIITDSAESDEDDEDEDEDELDEDEPVVPFVPFKSNRRRNNMPNLNNFFPMVFSFPRGVSRGSTDYDSTPGMITAIANSYSTGKKGGVASSMATAYGGAPPQGKKHRRAQPVQE